MKLDSMTLKVLSNFSNINNSIFVKAGNELRTMNNQTMGEAIIPDVFPEDFAISDVRQFLGCLSLFDSPDVEFNQKFLTISSGSASIKFFYTNPELITHPTKRLKLPSEDLTFHISEEELSQIHKVASILSCLDVKLSAEKSNVKITVEDKGNKTSNSSSMVVEGSGTKGFSTYTNIEIWKIIPGPYDVTISSEGLCLFENKASPIKYFSAASI